MLLAKLDTDHFYTNMRLVQSMTEDFSSVKDGIILVDIDPGIEKAVSAYLKANPMIGYSDVDEFVRHCVRSFIAYEGGNRVKRKGTPRCKFYNALRARV